MGNGRVAIAVMAKAPRPGQVKTRLCPPLLPEQAAAMGAAFLRDVTGNLAAAAQQAPIDAFVAFAPAGTEARFDGVIHPGTRLLLADGVGEMPEGIAGFGRCLWQATERLFAMGYEAACVLNADSPTLPTAFLVRLATQLLAPGRRCVIGPADDGGYYVLGMQSPQPQLYAAVAWSTDAVAEQTFTRAAEIRLPVHSLPRWYDVDDRAALLRLLEDIGTAGHDPSQIPYAAPATCACIDRLGLIRQIAA